MRTLDAIKRHQPLELEEGEESELQDFIYVGDVAKANILALKSPVANCAFNIVAVNQSICWTMKLSWEIY